MVQLLSASDPLRTSEPKGETAPGRGCVANVPFGVAGGLATSPAAESALLAADMSKTCSTSPVLLSSRCELAVIVPVRFRVIRERRLRLTPLLLAVLAEEFEREGPGGGAEGGSGMDCVLVPKSTLGTTDNWAKQNSLSANPCFRKCYVIQYTLPELDARSALNFVFVPALMASQLFLDGSASSSCVVSFLT